ncbi:hypothetical protein BGZ63DRAFT_399939 [Mariannaea sp. PMI_226]|nr:hypothetical protein BGZ63DRAFT_399939 [Mariannaea sp. PMI_226]
MSPSPKSPTAPDEHAAQTTVPTNNVETSAGDVKPESSTEEGEIEESTETNALQSNTAEKGAGSPEAPPLPDGPPLPNEPIPEGPPLPNEPVPETKDDGWDCQWDAVNQAWYFVNRFTGKTQWENPRVSGGPVTATSTATASSASALPHPPNLEQPAAGGYNPAIHGDYDPNAWYAKGEEEEAEPSSVAAHDPSSHGTTVSFNRFTGQFQTDDMGPNRHSDEAKSRRQMNAFFDVDAAANSHDGRSLKAERAGKKPSKSEVKAFKEKRRARKEEKRRAWLRD